MDLELILKMIDLWKEYSPVVAPALFRLEGWLVDLPEPHGIPAEFQSSVRREIIVSFNGANYSVTVYHHPQLEHLTSQMIVFMGHYIIVPIDRN